MDVASRLSGTSNLNLFGENDLLAQLAMRLFEQTMQDGMTDQVSCAASRPVGKNSGYSASELFMGFITCV